jgi:hypothetical protein
MSGKPGQPVPQTRRWLTTIVRPVGTLDRSGVDQVRMAISVLATCSDMVVVDLSAARVAAPRGLAVTLLEPAMELDRAGRCLLLRGVPPQLRAELDRAAVPAITLADVPESAGA